MITGEIKARFIEPMLLQRVSSLPQGVNWSYEVKLDGYRAVAIKTNGTVLLRSRNNKNFDTQYPAIVKALTTLPDETVIDGEVVALDRTGRPSFNALQNAVSGVRVVYYVFDVLILDGRDVMAEPLSARRDLLRSRILPKVGEPVRESAILEAGLSDVIAAIRAHGLEGIVAKRLDSRYGPGQRSGAWLKMRINRAKDFVIGGYTLGSPIDAVIFGYYDGDRLIYAGRTRSGFTPGLRAALYRRFRGLEIADCPFANLPEARPGRWGQGLTAEKMKECRWLRPALVAQFEFVEWTPDNHLRHSRFVGLRAHKAASEVHRED